MLTNPSTLGLFDEDIAEVAEIFHSRGRAPLLRRRQPERGRRQVAARATWASTSSTTTCTRRSRSRTAAAARAAGRSRCAPTLEPFLPSPQVVRDGDAFRLDRDRPKSIGRVRGLRRPVRRVRPLVRVHARLRRRPAGDVRDGGAQRELRARPAARRLRARLRPALHARVRPLRARAQEGARDHRARRRQAADGLRHPPADDLLPARRARRR